jgi:hypothetical protein
MLEFLKRLFGKKAPAMKLDAKPLQVNPTPSAREERRLARIGRLKQALANGDKRPEVREELKRLEGRI